jgi:hypothetical protein
VSDFNKNFTNKAYYAIIGVQQSETKTTQKDIHHESTHVRKSINIHVPLMDLHQNALPGIPVPQ